MRMFTFAVSAGRQVKAFENISKCRFAAHSFLHPRTTRWPETGRRLTTKKSRIPTKKSQNATTSDTKPVFVYGVGLDWGLLPHLGLRLQYRGNLYKAPDLTTVYTSTGAFTHTAEPMIGVYFRL